MKKLIPVLLVITAAWIYSGTEDTFVEPAPAAATTTTAPATFVAGSQLSGAGAVVGILPDDNDGSRHQRFIVRLPGGRTLLIAHNIDLAPRVVGLAKGDMVEFNGEFEPNPQGGVIHWTHRDPQGRHVAGWIRHKGRTYQ